MKLRRWAVAGVASVVWIGAGLACAQANAPGLPFGGGGGRIAGTVVNAINGNPLVQARVELRDTRNLKSVAATLSSDDGQFELTRLPPGKYVLSGAKKGFIAAGYQQHEQYSTAIVTGAGLDTEHLVLRLAPFAVISGKVLDEAGEPVRRAAVSLYVESRGSGVERIQGSRFDNTDDQGYYEFANLNAGTYFIGVTATPWYAVHRARTQPEGENQATSVDASLDVAYPMTYYKDAVDPDGALPIPVRGGDRLEIDMHLSPAPALHLLLQVPDNGAHGFTMPMLEKPAFNGMDYVPLSGGSMVSPGVYEIDGVVAGRYRVRMPATGGEGSSRATELEIDITSDGQELEASKGEATGEVKASVTILGEDKLPREMMMLLRNSKRVVGFQRVDEKGGVEFHDVTPGRYEVLAQVPGKSYAVVHIAAGDKTSAGHSIEVKAGVSLTVAIALAGGAANVEGFAKRDGKAAAGAMVVLVPKNPEGNRELFRRDQSDLDGSFSLREVIPGTYTVCAIEDGWELEWSRAAVIAPYCQKGASVTVGSGSGSIRLQNAVEVHAK
jgi:hypothetical protein